MDMNKLKKELEKIVLEQEKHLQSEGKTNFYDISLDDLGVPYSIGNYDETYEDGFDNGYCSGEYNLAKKLLDMME